MENQRNTERDSDTLAEGYWEEDERLYWMAYPERRAPERHGLAVGAAAGGMQGSADQREWLRPYAGDGDESGGMADPRHEHLRGSAGSGEAAGRGSCASVAGRGADSRMGVPYGAGREPRQQGSSTARYGNSAVATGGDGRMGEPIREGLEEQRSLGGVLCEAPGNDERQGPGPTNGFWRNADWLLCRDGRWRPARSGSFVLAHGVAQRMGLLRLAGNAINLQQATAFVRAGIEVLKAEGRW